MATVTGITAERAQEIEDASVVSAEISQAGHLLLHKHGGEVVDAGAVVPAPIDAWPVGSIFIATTSTNPSTLLGGGTWVRWGQGRVPVSLDSTQTEFDTSEETGGEKTVTLTEAQMPVHKHGVGTLATNNQGNHNHSLTRRENVMANAVGSTGGVGHGAGPTSDDINTSSAGAHAHTITGDTAEAGADAAHNNLQPYIVAYFWKRTA